MPTIPFSPWLLVGGAFAVCVLMAAISSLASKRYTFRDGFVCGVIGVMGSGKSMFVVAKVLLPAAKAIASRRGLTSTTGRPVTRLITNFNVDLPFDARVEVLDGARLWDHLLELALTSDTGRLDAVVIIDEAHLFIPSSKLKVAQKAAYLCSMARKLNAEIWWITQNEMKIHARLRADSSLIWKVGRHASLLTLVTGPSSWFVAKAFEPERLSGPRATVVDRRFYRMSKVVLRAYNSFDLIVPDAEVDVSLDSLSGRRNATLQLDQWPAPVGNG